MDLKVKVIHGRKPDLIEIRLYFKQLRKQKYISTGIKVPKKHFVDGEVKAKQPNYNRFNNSIRRIVSKVYQVQDECNARGSQVTPLDIDKAFGGVKTPTSFVEFFESELKHQYATLTQGSYRNQLQTLNKLKEFNPYATFKDINYEFVEKFDAFLASKGLSLNSRWKHHKDIKKYLRRAMMKKYISFDPSENPYNFFEVKKQNGTRRALTKEQVRKIMKLTYKSVKSYDASLDYFKFSLHTGLRISDCVRLTQDHIVGDRIKIQMEKTRKEVIIPLSDVPKSILKKYQGQLPKLNPVTINMNLKQIQADAGITQFPLTMHIARHTFLTFLAAKTGNLFKVMKLGGISKPSTAMVYIDLANDLFQEAQLSSSDPLLFLQDI